MPEYCNKAMRQGYDPPPFYYLERREDYARIVAWSPDAQQMSALVFALLATFPQDVDILFKLERDEEHPLDGHYQRYHAIATLNHVRDAIAAHLVYVFTISGFVLCLRKPDEPEYLALDEFGTLFYYTNSEETFPIFESCGFVNQQHPFVDEGGCYVMRNWDEEDTWRDSFIKALNLTPSSCEPRPEL